MKNLNEIFEILENKSISIDRYEEDGELKGYELNTYTNNGVNLIPFLDFRDEGKDAENVADFIQEFTEWVNDFDVDEQIDIHRQDYLFCKHFTIAQALKDFKNYKKEIKAVLKLITKTTTNKTNFTILKNTIMSYEKAMKWNKKHVKGTKQVCIMHTDSGFTPSSTFLEMYFEYRAECEGKGIKPAECEYYYRNREECRTTLNKS